MKRSFRIISLVLALTLVFSLFPSFWAGTAFAAEDAAKYVITSNVEWASDKTDTTKPYLRLKNGKKWIEGGDGTQIDATITQAIQIANYTSISETLPLSYAEVDGLKIYYSDFAKYEDPTVIDTKTCPNLNGRQVKIRLNNGNPQIQFDRNTGNPITQDIKINFVFQTQAAETEYKLNATAGENGKILEAKYLHPTDDGNSVYGLWVRPDNQYQLLSYTMDGKTVPLELKNEDYTTWEFSAYFYRLQLF